MRLHLSKERPWYTVSLEWQGDKFIELPYIEYIVRRASDSSGTWMDGSGICDAAWYFDGTAKHPGSRRSSRRMFHKLKTLVTSMRFSRYVRLKLLHYFADPKNPSKTLAQFRRGKSIPVKRRRAA
jgi:hypothetical protein